MVDDKSSEPLRKQKQKTIDMIEKDQLKEGSQSTFDAELETTAHKDDSKQFAKLDIPTEGTKGEPESEVSGDMRKRFSRKIPIDEQALRENAPETDTTKGEESSPDE